MSKNLSKKTSGKTIPERAYKAGCGRTWRLASEAPDFAYTAQEFAECPNCPHLVESEETRPFCTLRPQNSPHPFAALAALDLPR